MSKSRQGGYIGLLTLLISVAVLVFVMYSYFDTKNPETGKSQADINRGAIDDAKYIQREAEVRAKATDLMMDGMR